ncbi:hypothetical protein GE21DRAFT_1280019 [Neurospora crassa]|nr:hypothetical protein GE21DRAFT_1280019 [Neurospora crassa]
MSIEQPASVEGSLEGQGGGGLKGNHEGKGLRANWKEARAGCVRLCKVRVPSTKRRAARAEGRTDLYGGSLRPCAQWPPIVDYGGLPVEMGYPDVMQHLGAWTTLGAASRKSIYRGGSRWLGGQVPGLTG